MWNRELLRRLDAHLARGDQLMAEHTRAFEDLRKVLAEQTQVLRVLTKEIKGFGVEIKEFGAETAAQRQALFRILDKLD
jgi:hypothetical protein